MKYLKATLLGSGALASLLLSASLVSCQDEDFGYTTQEIRDSVYARNFEKMYGKIAEDQIWDFSSYNLSKLGLTGGPEVDVSNALTTRAANTYLKTTYDDWYTITRKTIIWLNEHMKEKENNKDKVMSFSLKQNGDFYILPIYQGQSGMIWDFYLEDNNGAHLIWQKSDDFQYTEDYTKWEEYHYNSGAGETPNFGQRLVLSTPFSHLNGANNNGTGIRLRFVLPKGMSELKGSFYLKNGNDPIKIDNNYNSWFDESENQLSKDSNGGTGDFHFKNEYNTEINESGYLNAPEGRATNQVNLTKLVGYEKNGVKIGDNFENLIFIGSNISSTGQTLGDSFCFYTWSAKRIRVYTKYGYTATAPTSLKNFDGSGNNVAYLEGHTISKNDIQSKLIKIDASKINGIFNFNLKTTARTDGDIGLSDLFEDHRSNSEPSMMRAITELSGSSDFLTEQGKTDLKDEFNRLAGSTILPDNNFEYMVIGCEDASGGKFNSAGTAKLDSDWDFNDVVFLLVAPKLPDLYEKTIEKRYMIEDLGSTFDFDFNDIIVDVKEEHVRKLSSPYQYTFTQTATIKHLCGTIPFQIWLGDQQFGTKPMLGHNGTDEYGFTPRGNDYTWTVTKSGTLPSGDIDAAKLEASYKSLREGLWDPDKNNIKVYVWTAAGTDGTGSDIYWDGAGTSVDNIKNGNLTNTQGLQLVEFPKNGKFPYIIATDPSVPWMKELVSIPRYWFKTSPVDEWYEYNQTEKPNWGDLENEFTIPNAYAGKEFNYSPKYSYINGFYYPSITLGSELKNNRSYNGDDDIKVTFLLPPNSTFSGRYKGTGSNNQEVTCPSDGYFEVKNPTNEPVFITSTITDPALKLAAQNGNLILESNAQTDCSFNDVDYDHVRIFLDTKTKQISNNEILLENGFWTCKEWAESYKPSINLTGCANWPNEIYVGSKIRIYYDNYLSNNSAEGNVQIVLNEGWGTYQINATSSDQTNNVLTYNLTEEMLIQLRQNGTIKLNGNNIAISSITLEKSTATVTTLINCDFTDISKLDNTNVAVWLASGDYEGQFAVNYDNSGNLWIKNAANRNNNYDTQLALLLDNSYLYGYLVVKFDYWSSQNVAIYNQLNCAAGNIHNPLGELNFTTSRQTLEKVIPITDDMIKDGKGLSRIVLHLSPAGTENATYCFDNISVKLRR